MPTPWLSRIFNARNFNVIRYNMNTTFHKLLKFNLKNLIQTHGHFDEERILKYSHQLANNIEKNYLSQQGVSKRNLRIEHRQRLDELDHIRDDYAYLLGQHILPIVQHDLPQLAQSEVKPNLQLPQLKSTVRKYSINKQQTIDEPTLSRFLAHQVFLFRTGLDHNPLLWLLDAMEQDVYLKKWVTNKLITPAEIEQGELWATGFHEWIPRSNISDVLIRSAGLTELEPFTITQGNESVSLIDWRTLQQNMRSPVKYMYFENKDHRILSGHTPAIKIMPTPKSLKGVQTKGSYAFHSRLTQSFEKSQSQYELVKQLQSDSDELLYSGNENFRKPRLTDNQNTFFTVRGFKTDDFENLRPYMLQAKKQRDEMFQDMLDKTATP